MTQHIPYLSIGQFREAVRDVIQRAKRDCLPAPTVVFHGTVKLHGTNGSINYDVANGTSYPQSRNRVLSLEDDNAGFAAFHHKNREVLENICKKFVTLTPKSVVVFGEWVGKGVQSGVAMSQVDKKFIIFGILVDDDWIHHTKTTKILNPFLQELNDVCVYHIEQFQTFDLEIDFNKPELSQQQLIDITNAVEAECPVGKFFGVSGVGEGVCWSADGIRFKVKGEKHSESKVKVLAAPDVEKIATMRAFVDYAVTEYRLEKLFDKFVNECGNETTPKNTGQFVALVCKDVVSEECDTLVESNLTWKDASSHVAKRASNFWLNRVNKF